MGIKSWIERSAERAVDRERWREQEAQTRARHRERMKTATAIAVMTVVCHEHTLDFLELMGSQHGSWVPVDRARTEVVDGDLTRFTLSGPQIVVLLSTLGIRSDIPGIISTLAVSDAQRAMCTRLYELLAAAVDSVSPSGSAPPEVVIADKASVVLDPQG